MTIQELRERLHDCEGEASACIDRDCSCKDAVREARMELDDAIRAAAEDSVEAAYRDAGFDAMSPLEQWYADGAR